MKIIENLDSGAASFSMPALDLLSSSMIELRVTDPQPYSDFRGIEDPDHLLDGRAWRFNMDMGVPAQNMDAIMTDEGITVLFTIPSLPGIQTVMTLNRVEPLAAESCDAEKG